MASQVAARKGIAMINPHARGLDQGTGPRRPSEARRRGDQRTTTKWVYELFWAAAAPLGTWTRSCSFSKRCETASARSGAATLHGRFVGPVLEMGLCSANAGNMAMFYLKKPTSLFARLAKASS